MEDLPDDFVSDVFSSFDGIRDETFVCSTDCNKSQWSLVVAGWNALLVHKLAPANEYGFPFNSNPSPFVVTN